MTRYETLKTKPKRFLSLTGYTLEEFSALLPYFPSDFWHPSKQRRLRANPERVTHYKNRCLPNFEISCSLF